MEKDLSAFRPTRIWKRMPSDRRLKAAEFFWTDEQSTDQQVEAVTALAAHMKFRTKSVIALPLDADFSMMRSNAGIESLAHLADGRLLAIEEGPDGEADGISHAWLIGPDGESGRLGYRRANNFRPTDAASLPNGDVLVLERRYTTVGGVAARLKLVPAAAI